VNQRLCDADAVAGFTSASLAGSALNGQVVDKLTMAALNYDTGYRDGIAAGIEALKQIIKDLDEEYEDE
jgi:hypothetical protein